MKKTIIIAVLAAMIAFCGCAKKEVPVFGVSLDKWELIMEVGDVFSAIETVAPSISTDMKISWSSSDPSVAVIDKEGTITAIAPGYTLITAKAVNGKSVILPVTVIPNKAEGIVVTPKLLTVAINSNTNDYQFTATVLPPDAGDKTVVWSSSNTAVATVDSVTGVVTKTGLLTGIVTIKATSIVNAAVFDTATFVVMQLRAESPISLLVGEQYSPELTVIPTNAPDQDFEWKSNDSTIASVDAITGQITGVSIGNVWVAVTLRSNPDVSSGCYVEVMPSQAQSIEVTPTLLTIATRSNTNDYPFTATVLPADAADKTVTWSSNNTAVATVDPGTGVVTKTGLHSGIVTITATSTVNAAVSGTGTFVVMDLRVIPSTISLFTGEDYTIALTVQPADAPDQDFEWTSESPNIATVDQNGKITAVSNGDVWVAVKLRSNPDVASGCYVEVKGNFTESVNGTNFDFIGVEAGSFGMGQSSDPGTTHVPDDYPQHQVTLTKDYAIGKTEITQKQWVAVMGSLPSGVASTWGLGDNVPVYAVTYNEVQAFISALNSLTGKIYRLPTEAEWEYAARGGNKTQGYLYSGSNNVGNVAWYQQNTLDPSNPSFSDGKARPVATKAANELGIFDMSGNVAEWVNDWFTYYTSASQIDPEPGIPTGGGDRVVRNGSVGFAETEQTVTYRGSLSSYNSYSYLGFRLAITL
jgi:formylglycine-generating enzyme required for sulfatase activity